MKIRIKSDKGNFEASFHDTNTAKKIYDSLPLHASISTWGDEIYFEIPVEIDLDNTAKEVVEKGDLGYWPSGKCFCIFFGKTPASKGNEIKPASAVNVFGEMTSDLSGLKKFKDGDDIYIERC